MHVSLPSSRTEKFQRDHISDARQGGIRAGHGRPRSGAEGGAAGTESYAMPRDEDAVAALRASAQAQKTAANALFASKNYAAARVGYEDALATLTVPAVAQSRYDHDDGDGGYAAGIRDDHHVSHHDGADDDTARSHDDYEVVVLHSNITACHVMLAEWKEAVASASRALDSLQGREPADEEAGGGQGADRKRASSNKGDTITNEHKDRADDVEEEIVSGPAAAAIAASPAGKRQADGEKLRMKILLRRAKARSELGGWSNLQGAEEDYKALSEMKILSASDRMLVSRQLRALAPRVQAAQQKETAEMMSKLKELGNGILKPFGLSTDNFQMVKDEKTGGYSMNFNQGR